MSDSGVVLCDRSKGRVRLMEVKGMEGLWRGDYLRYLPSLGR